MKIENWFIGVVEDIADPHQDGRVRVRCFNYHTFDEQLLPTSNLLWAPCLFPIDNTPAGKGGQFGGYDLIGAWVMGFFRDGSDMQDPVVIGGFSIGSGAAQSDHVALASAAGTSSYTTPPQTPGRGPAILPPQQVSGHSAPQVVKNVAARQTPAASSFGDLKPELPEAEAAPTANITLPTASGDTGAFPDVAVVGQAIFDSEAIPGFELPTMASQLTGQLDRAGNFERSGGGNKTYEKGDIVQFGSSISAFGIVDNDPLGPYVVIFTDMNYGAELVPIPKNEITARWRLKAPEDQSSIPNPNDRADIPDTLPLQDEDWRGRKSPVDDSGVRGTLLSDIQ